MRTGWRWSIALRQFHTWPEAIHPLRCFHQESMRMWTVCAPLSSGSLAQWL